MADSDQTGHQAEHEAMRLGSGNWEAFPHARIPEIQVAARRWAQDIGETGKPWLCWCVSDDWCVLQQRLVQSVGWTPVVGHDTTVSKPVVVPGGVYVDFNALLRLPRLYPHFVLEWIHLFADRLAFWHSDFLLSKRDMEKAATCFENLRPGELAMPWISSRMLMRNLARVRPVSNSNRLFEVIGCNTREASREQYEEGGGFWRHPEKHPNNHALPGDYPYWEHSVGISLWARRHRDRHKLPGVDTRTGHANSWKKKMPTSVSNLERGAKDKKRVLLEQLEDIRYYARRLRIEDLLEG